MDQEIVWPIIDVLRKNKIYDNTMIIITGDHGEAFGEHDSLGHGLQLYDEVIHIPLIIKLPSPQSGRQIDKLVQSIDIMPTILDMLGIELPYYAQGVSLIPLMKTDPIVTFNRNVFGDNRSRAYFRSNKWKLIL